ncbi:MAG: potassium transporter Kup [Verrucomicrobiota bacterium]
MDDGEDFKRPERKLTPAAVLAVLGIVYGDIGTSPLYAFKECFRAPGGVPLEEATIYGVLSLVFWSLILVISVKYLLFVLYADNEGEGGVLALMALVAGTRDRKRPNLRLVLLFVGVAGACLLFADAMITPAISVLSAVEGIEAFSPDLADWALPIAAVVLLVLFYTQHFGTSRIGVVFGPVMIIWFGTIAVFGFMAIAQNPEVLWAIGPWHAVEFFYDHSWVAFAVLGTVFLVVTGGEALYADMGHFGRGPICIGWFSLVLPALVINYFGQGALLLRDHDQLDQLFYNLTPDFLLIPMIILATLATVIASQAVIAGAFSLSGQAMQLGYLPRLFIQQTSDKEQGQIYVPAVNWLLMLGTLALLFHFQSSANLTAAYGVAVSTTMLITTFLLFFCMRRIWKWKWYWAAAASFGFLIVDVLFFTANLTKVADGGWIPLVVAAVLVTMMSTWQAGRELLANKLRPTHLATRTFLENIVLQPPVRVPGTAIFLTENAGTVPGALLHNLKHNKILHEKVVLMSLHTEPVPRVPRDRRIEVTELGQGFWAASVHSGFAERPNLPRILKGSDHEVLQIDELKTTFFLGNLHLRVNVHKKEKLFAWQRIIFAFLLRNSAPPEGYFHIPPNHVVELGSQLEM